MASNTLSWSRFALFADEVYFSTDLSRRAGEVLNHARRGPVTISRNKEQFALLKREHVAELVGTAGQFGPILDLLEGALSKIEGKEPPPVLGWLKAFDTDDLRKMIREVLFASVNALRETGDWESVNAIIHEWHESGLVAGNEVLDAASQATSEKIPIPDPRPLLESESVP